MAEEAGRQQSHLHWGRDLPPSCTSKPGLHNYLGMDDLVSSMRSWLALNVCTSVSTRDLM